MATSVVLNGATYSIPAYGDSGWAQGQGNLSSYLVAVAAGTLQTTGGTFTLSAEVDFGATYGVKSAYFKTETASPATVGVLRLALTDEVCWGPANLALSVASSRLKFAGQTLLIASDLPGSITQNREVYIAGTPSANYTGSLTVIDTVTAFVANGVNLNFFINGLIQDVTYDYTETSTTRITTTTPMNTGDRISLRWTTY